MMMEQNVDRFLDNVFGNLGSQLLLVNIFIGALLLITGIFFLIKASGDKQKSKRTIGLICIVIGALTILSRVVQMLIL